ncbi:metabotropic glutamate receptor 1-like [Brevipalpus obovatus]|uniref:metabotropic glutamate receptor 1-like n=1 Tax=Brevipalpus obovatus TaxID=246614 RepID=UPI003D9EB770
MGAKIFDKKIFTTNKFNTDYLTINSNCDPINSIHYDMSTPSSTTKSTIFPSQLAHRINIKSNNYHSNTHNNHRCGGRSCPLSSPSIPPTNSSSSYYLSDQRSSIKINAHRTGSFDLSKDPLFLIYPWRWKPHIMLVIIIIFTVILVPPCAPSKFSSSSSSSSSISSSSPPSSSSTSTSTTSTSVPGKRATTRHTVATITGDLVIGALFPVHHAPEGENVEKRICGHVRETYGIQRVEAAMKTIDEINQQIPHLRLGIEIRDSCWNSPIALEQSIEFIRDVMAASDERNDLQRKAENSNGLQLNSLFGRTPLFPPAVSLPGLRASLNQTSNNSSPFCTRPPKSVKNIVGVVGPASSQVTIQVQNLLQLFNIPQVGYSSTSTDLTNKQNFKYFLRVVPSDIIQARVIAEVIAYHNWTWIALGISEGNYGNSLSEAFKEVIFPSNDQAPKFNICIALSDMIRKNDVESSDKFIAEVLARRKVKVIVCACEGETISLLYKSIRKYNATGKLLIVGADGWADRMDVVQGIHPEAHGGISIRIHSPHVEDFDEYYFNLNPYTNSRNPWFKEFWEWKFGCTLAEVQPPPELDAASRKLNRCTGRESLNNRNYTQDSKLAFVIKSIWTMAYGLNEMHQKVCGNRTDKGICKEMLPFKGDKFLEFLFRVTFKWHNDTISFDKNGDPPATYDIMNFQKIGRDYRYEQVAIWDSKVGHLQMMNGKSFQWPSKILNDSEIVPVSICSEPCKMNERKQQLKEGKHSEQCCWLCIACQPGEYKPNETTCTKCDQGFWPNENLTGCYEIEEEYIKWTETGSLVAIAIALIGFMMTLFAMIVFIRHNDTPVVKSSTRELSYMIMVGMFLCYSTTFALIARPSEESCFLTAVLPGFSFAVIYASLVTKTNRIARILAGSKKRIITKKPRFMSSSAQVVISLILILIECGIIAGIVVDNPPRGIKTYPTDRRVVRECNTTRLSIIAPLGFDFFLIAMCTVYAVKTRNVPENFNEAKFIGFTMYTTLVIWIAFIPIYFGSDLRVLTMCLCISFSAIVALILLFFPKLYIILFKPEKNNRSFFTTAKNVRCHIGYVPTLGISRHSSHSTSEFSVDSPRNHSLEVKHHHNQITKDGRSIQSLSMMTDKSTSSLLAMKPPGKRKSGLNLFERFRVSKQDKIAANVQEKIRAVRAAEALDRQTHRRVPGRGPPRQSSSSGIEVVEESDTNTGNSNKLKLVTMLRQALGEDANKIPGFNEFVELIRRESRRVLVESSAQTSYDLLETWFPALRHRLPPSKNGSMIGVSVGVGGGSSHGESDVEGESDPNHQHHHTLRQRIRHDTGINAIGKMCLSPRDNKLYPMERDTAQAAFPWLDNSYASYSHQTTGMYDENKQIVPIRVDMRGSQSSTLRKRTSSMCSTDTKVRASEESLLSGANSCVIEESASSGGESSPSSGVVYKNIIINLGGTSNVPGEMVDIGPPPNFESHHHDIGMATGSYMPGA